MDQHDQKCGSGTRKKAAEGVKSARGGILPVPVYSCALSDLPITREEIQHVLAALGPDLAALFSED